MKKKIILGSFLALAISGTAQTGAWTYGTNKITTTNTIGIGVTTPTTGNPLEVETISAEKGIMITQKSGGGAALFLNNAGLGGHNWAMYSLNNSNTPAGGHFVLQDATTSSNRFFISGSNGNVGIGTTAPATKFDIVGNGRFSTNLEIGTANANLNALIPINITQSTSQMDGIKFIAQSGGRAAFEVVQTASQSNSRFKIYADGSTYIGNFPNLTFGASSSMLTVAGDARFAAYGTGNALGNGIEILGNNLVPFRRGISTGNDNVSGAFNFFVNSNQSGAAFNFKNGLTNTNLMSITPDAVVGVKVSIGTTKPQGTHADFKFAVDGKVVAQSLFITATGVSNWADYVFAPDYKLPNLYDIEAYYKANKHLPEIPSAAEVKENGINVAEINTLLLKKIEELTILMVNQQKQIDELKNKTK